VALTIVSAADAISNAISLTATNTNTNTIVVANAIATPTVITDPTAIALTIAIVIADRHSARSRFEGSDDRGVQGTDGIRFSSGEGCDCKFSRDRSD